MTGIIKASSAKWLPLGRHRWRLKWRTGTQVTKIESNTLRFKKEKILESECWVVVI